ncbi:MAG TPA: Gfo/Idh/MocA family oxidoreductase [Microlunatus sp.]|nr:Gfo/Idh/MocA family oxidoreductase [Microlunatus sp.]
MNEIGIGIVGANPDVGWSFLAHVPAIAATPGLRVAAVSTTRVETARRAAELLGGLPWFTDAGELAAAPDVDLVLVSVRVPYHRELIEAALGHGKAVLSEWPLARTTAEAELLTEAAAAAGVAGFVGLQGRYDPVLNRARKIIAEGGLGELITINARSSRAKGGEVDPAAVYTLDAGNGAGTVDVLGGHLIDQLRRLVPDLAVDAGSSSLSHADHVVAGTGEGVIATAPDVFTAAVSAGSAVGGVTAWDGDPAAATDIVVAGTLGKVELRSVPFDVPRLRQPQLAPYTGRLTTAGVEQELRPEPDDLPPPVGNIAGLYRQVAADLRDGTVTAPTFADGLELHRLLDRLR